MSSAKGVEINAAFFAEIETAGAIRDTGMERWRDM
jgi:hypothetical protein